MSLQVDAVVSCKRRHRDGINGVSLHLLSVLATGDLAEGVRAVSVSDKVDANLKETSAIFTGPQRVLFTADRVETAAEGHGEQITDVYFGDSQAVMSRLNTTQIAKFIVHLSLLFMIIFPLRP